MHLWFRVLLLGLAATLAACHDHHDDGSPTATVNDIGGQPVSFSASAGRISNLRSMPAPAHSGLVAANGAFSFDIGGLAPGSTITLTVQLPAGTGPGWVAKCNATACTRLGGVVVNGDSVAITLTDGGAADADGAANGTISDPDEFTLARLDKTSLDFGDVAVGETRLETLIVSSVTTAQVSVFRISTSGEPFETFVEDTTLARMGSIRIPVLFKPTAAGPFSGELRFRVNNVDVTVPLSGNAVSGGSSSSGSSSGGSGSTGGSSSSSSSSGGSGSTGGSSGSSSSSSSSGSSGGSTGGSSGSSSSSSSSGSSGGSGSTGGSSGSGNASGLFPFTQIAESSSSSGGGATPRGTLLFRFPILNGDDCRTGSSCTRSARVATLDPNAVSPDVNFDTDIGDLGVVLRYSLLLDSTNSAGNILAQGLSLTLPPGSPVQVSSENQATAPFCSQFPVRADYANPQATLFFYQLRGADGACGGSDDIFHFTPFGAAATTPPLAAPVNPFGDPPEAFYDAQGKALSFLVQARDSGGNENLLRYDANFQNPKTVIANLSGFFLQIAQNQGNKIYADKVHIYRVTADGTATSIHDLTAATFGLDVSDATDDGVFFYFIEKDDSSGVYNVERQRLDGSDQALRIGDLPGDSSIFRSLIGTTDNRVLVLGATNIFSNPEQIYSIPKNPATPPVAATLVDTVPGSTGLSLIATQGSRLYYNEQPSNGTNSKAFSASDDGSSVLFTDKARWLYAVYDNSTRAGLYQDRAVTDLVQVHGFSDYLHTRDLGGTLSVIHLADNSSRDLVTLNYPAGTDMTVSFPDHGLPLGGGSISFGGSAPQSDVFAFDLNATDPALRFAQLTNTPNLSERPPPDLNLRPVSRNAGRRVINLR